MSHRIEQRYLRTDIPWPLLPKAFQDTALATKQLSPGLLWVNTLCILQDGPTDWHREAAAMASIYQNSHITITATTSENCNQGLYSSLNPEYVAKELGHQIYFRSSLPYPINDFSWQYSDFP
jgi:hypothetical protein